MKVYVVELCVDATVEESWICKTKEEAENVKEAQMVHLLDYFDIKASPDDKDLEEKIEDYVDSCRWGITYYNRDLDCFPYIDIEEKEI